MLDRKVPWTIHCALWLAAAGLGSAAQPAPPAAATPAALSAKPTPSVSEILAAAPASAWRPLVDEHTLYMQLPAGRVIIELEPALAPRTVAAIETLVRMHYFEGAAVTRVQDNYVAQWSVPGSTPDESRPVPENMRTLAPEFAVPASMRTSRKTAAAPAASTTAAPTARGTSPSQNHRSRRSRSASARRRDSITGEHACQQIRGDPSPVVGR